jgi:hypothetical protein
MPRPGCGLPSEELETVLTLLCNLALLTDNYLDISTEVWSYSFDNATNSFSVADLAALSPTGTESDAIQLWSYGFLALSDPSCAGSLDGGS